MRFVRVAIPIALMACGGSTAGSATPVTPPPAPPPPPPAVVNRTFDIAVTGSNVPVRPGQSTQFTAKITDHASGASVTGKGITWSTSRPDLVNVSQDGSAQLIAGTAVGFTFFEVDATVDSQHFETPGYIYTADWAAFSSADPVTLKTSFGDYMPSATAPSILFYARCNGGTGRLEAFIDNSQQFYFNEITTSVSYRFAPVNVTVNQTWNPSTDFRALFFPATSAKAFLQDAAASDSLVIRYPLGVGGTAVAAFDLRDFKLYYPALQAICPDNG